MKVENNFNDPQKFDVPTSDSTTPIKEVWGWLLMLDMFPDEKFFISYDDHLDTWVVSELSTGMAISKEVVNKSRAIEIAENVMTLHKDRWVETKQKSREILREKMVSYPINELIQ